MIRDNLKEVSETIIRACNAVKRTPSSVTLVAVSKTKPLSLVTECLLAEDSLKNEVAGGNELPFGNAAVFGENYVQELVEKYETLSKSDPELASRIEWHMIGHLQRNKVKYIIDKVTMIHSVDSIRLAEQIESEAAKKAVCMDILLEVNIAGEESKWGFSAEEALDAVLTLSDSHPHLRIRGYMTSAPYTEDEESNRVHFRNLHTLFTDTKKVLSADNTLIAKSTYFDTLSMGMTGDYRVAVEEGATMVRVGTGIFGERNYH